MGHPAFYELFLIRRKRKIRFKMCYERFWDQYGSITVLEEKNILIKSMEFFGQNQFPRFPDRHIFQGCMS